MFGDGRATLACAGRRIGDAPLLDDSRRGTVVAFEGELDNASALLRLAPSSLPPSQLLTWMYERSGSEFTDRLEGRFALALWDGETSRLLLARDRIGVRPLFYGRAAGGLAFASDVDTLLAMRTARPSLRRESVAQFLSLLYVGTPDTLFDDVFALPPGATLICEGAGSALPGPLRMPTAWAAGPRHSGDPVDGTRSRFGAAVSRALTDDEGQVVLLSSGAGSVTFLAHAAASGRSLRTVTMGITGADASDERRAARDLARRFGASHETVQVDLRCLDALPAVTRSLGAPVGNPSALLAHALFRQLGPSARGVVCGDGGNEVFGGVLKYFQLMSALAGARMPRLRGRVHALGQRAWYGLRQAGLETLVHHAAAAYFRLVGTRGARASRELPRAAYEEALALYAELESTWSTARLDELLTPPLRATVGARRPEALLGAQLAEGGSTNLLQQLVGLRLATVVPHNILPYVERSAAAHGLAARFPYLDHELAGYLAKLPVELNYVRGYRHLMRRALGSPVPPAVYRRVKGFNPPLADWLRSARGRELAHDLLSPQAVARRGLFEPRVVADLLRRFRAGEHSLPTGRPERRQPLDLSIWTLIALEVFCREYF